MKNINRKFAAAIVMLSLFFVSQKAFAHCEIPCGIYEDSLRVSLISEHITTVEKSMKKIVELSKEATPNYNQLVRWVVNKEEHAEKIQEIVSQYFVHQRVKLTDSSDKEKYNRYIQQLTTLHEIAVYSMKAKQSTNLVNIENLRKSLKALEEAYFHTHKH